MQLNNFLHIIGGKFNNLKMSDNVITVDEFLEMAISEKKLEDNVCIIGQGLSVNEIKFIKAIKKQNPRLKIIERFHRKADDKHTHKSKSKNTIISDPVVINDNSFQAYLIADDDCADMSDHVTGCHIQGMVLIEAARQMTLAVSEKYLLDENSKNNSYCILNSMNINFINFVFPLEVIIEHVIEELSVSANQRYEIRNKTKFYQNDTICAEIDMRVKFYNKKFMEKKEKAIVDKMLKEGPEFLISNKNRLVA